MIALTLPYPPSVNHYWHACGNRRFIGARGVAFRKAVAEVVAAAGQKIDGRLSLVISVAPPDRRRRDLDNVVKAIQDSLQHAGCYDDDEQIDLLAVARMPVVKGGTIRVVIIPFCPSSLSMFP